MKNRILAVLLCCVSVFLSACGDLTFENKGNVNFERFQTVFVLPIQIDGIFAFSSANAAEDAYQYLVDELKAESGFRKVVSTVGSATDTDLSVWVSVREDYDYESDTITYYAQTKFLLTDSEGTELYSGQMSDTSDDLESAVYDTLSEVTHFFILPYRI